jgi:hypothetical protein
MSKAAVTNIATPLPAAGYLPIYGVNACAVMSTDNPPHCYVKGPDDVWHKQ